MADDDPDAPKTYKRYTGGAKTSSTPAATTSAAPVDPDAPSTYKRPDSSKPPEALPDPHAYKPPDWIPGANFLYKTNRVFDNAFTGGAADYLTAKAGDAARYFGIKNATPSVAQLRAETKQDRADVGPIASAVADTAGYGMGVGKVLGPLAGKLAPVAGRYGAAALEGTAASAVDVAGNHLGSDQPLNLADAGKHIIAGGLTGIGGQVAGDITAPIARRVGNFVQGLPGRGSEQWDWRTRQPEDAAAQIETYRQTAPPASITPERDAALTNASNALNQSVEPGAAAHVAQGVTGAALAQFGLPTAGMEQLANWGTMGGLTAGGVASKYGFNPVARTVNRVDRYINAGDALDQLYPALTGNRMSVDTSGWAPAIRQGLIGAQSTP